jgi:hypothetical protein
MTILNNQILIITNDTSLDLGYQVIRQNNDCLIDKGGIVPSKSFIAIYGPCEAYADNLCHSILKKA